MAHAFRAFPRRLMLSPAAILLCILLLAAVTWITGFYRIARVSKLQMIEKSSNNVVWQFEDIPASPDSKTLDSSIHICNTIYKRSFRAIYPQEDSKLIRQSSYFKPRSTVVNPLQINYITDPSDVCQGPDGAPYLLFMIPSMTHHAKIRETIRKTWGSVVHTPWPQTRNLPSVKIVFVLARTSHDTEEVLQKESSRYGDVLCVDFVDSYRNLTYKSLTSLYWASTRCSKARFVMKVDEDTFVNVPYLLHFLQYHERRLTRALVGYAILKPVCVRTGKWAVDFSAYPLSIFPRYLLGHSYVISADIIHDLVTMSQYLPFIPVEDATVTGVLAYAVNATRLHNIMFAKPSRTHTCSVVNNIQITVTRASAVTHRRIWEAVQSQNCSYTFLN